MNKRCKAKTRKTKQKARSVQRKRSTKGNKIIASRVFESYESFRKEIAHPKEPVMDVSDELDNP